MSEDSCPLAWLQARCHRHCDGDWEHRFGVRIQTLDSPGWAVDIDLIGTELEDVAFDGVQIGQSEHDWFHYRVA